ncbi:RAD50-interacting protein 1 [Sparganum proliferum]
MINDFETKINLLQDLVCCLFRANTTKVLLENEELSLTRLVKENTTLATEIERTCDCVPNLVDSLELELERSDEVLNFVTPLVHKIEDLEKNLHSLEIQETLSRYRSEVDAARVLGNADMALDAFTHLSRHLGAYNDSSSGDLYPSLPPYYYAMLTSFINCLWDEHTLERFCQLYRVLSNIRLPGALAGRRAISLAMRIILEKLEKRFLFNFYGSRLTNKLEKPEWYLTEVQTWMVLNDQWLTWIQDEHLRCPLPSSPLRVQFMRGLIGFVIDKMTFDLGLIAKPPKSYCSAPFLTASDSQLDKTKEAPEEPPGGLDSSPLATDPDLFGHLIDEVLNFENRLDGLCYPVHELRPVEVLTRLDVLHRWLCLESEIAHRRMQDLLSKTQTLAPEKSSDSPKTPQCAEDFVALVYAISRRGVQLRDAKARAYFFRVQQALLFTFLSSLSDRLPWLQGEKTKWETVSRTANRSDPARAGDPAVWTAILNALFFVCETMQDWTNDQYFVELWEDRDIRKLLEHPDPWIDEPNPSDEDSSKKSAVYGWKTISTRLTAALEELPSPKSPTSHEFTLSCPGVFADMFELYERRIRQGLEAVVSSLHRSLCEVSRDYRSDVSQWQRVSEPGIGRYNSGGGGGSTTADLGISGLSGKATDMFMLLTGSLSTLAKLLHPSLFARVWKPLFSRLNQYLYSQVIRRNHFTTVGAAQLQYDIAQCLRAIVLTYTDKAEDYIGECLDACKLLTLPQGVVELLKEELKATLTPGSRASSALMPLIELGISRLSPDEVYEILLLRL